MSIDNNEIINNIKVVILVPFACVDGVDEISGEAKELYDEYFNDAQTYQVTGKGNVGRLFIKDNIAMCILGEGKIESTLNCVSLLNDKRFDFSNTNFVLFGCCGCAYGRGVIGDIYVVFDVVDYDLGYHADAREDGSEDSHSWYPNSSFFSKGYIKLNNKLNNNVFNIIKDCKLNINAKVQRNMSETFNNEKWVLREPKVLKAASVSSDAYWKGIHDHNNAEYVVDFYKCKYPFYATDMEDISVTSVFNKYGLIDKLAIIRYSVNMDVFVSGRNPYNSWIAEQSSFTSTEFANIENVFNELTSDATDVFNKVLDKIC